LLVTVWVGTATVTVGAIGAVDVIVVAPVAAGSGSVAGTADGASVGESVLDTLGVGVLVAAVLRNRLPPNASRDPTIATTAITLNMTGALPWLITTPSGRRRYR
jgi:hypothetical protein